MLKFQHKSPYIHLDGGKSCAIAVNHANELFCQFSDDILSCSDTLNEENKVHQRYYQWIPLVLLVQGIISYVPAYIWKVAEGGLLHKLCENLGK